MPAIKLDAAKKIDFSSFLVFDSPSEQRRMLKNLNFEAVLTINYFPLL